MPKKSVSVVPIEVIDVIEEPVKKPRAPRKKKEVADVAVIEEPVKKPRAPRKKKEVIP